MKVSAIISLPMLLAATVGAITPASTAVIVPDLNLTRVATEAALPVAYHHRYRWTFMAYERYVPRAAYIPYVRSAPRAYAYVPPATAYYYIANRSTGMVAEVWSQSLQDKAQVALWTNYGSASEQWSIVPLQNDQFPLPPEDVWFLLKNRNSGLCLHTGRTKAETYEDDARVVQHTCDADASQMWRLRKKGNRVVLENAYAVNVKQERCLDAANGQFPSPPLAGAALIAHPCIPNSRAPNAVNQDWELVSVN